MFWLIRFSPVGVSIAFALLAAVTRDAWWSTINGLI